MELIDGNEIASAIVEELTNLVSSFGKTRPCVAFVRVGEDPASVSYVRKKEKTAGQIGIDSKLLVFPETISQEGFYGKSRSQRDPGIHGILVQAPCPVIWMTEPSSITSPPKGVDGFNATNLGNSVRRTRMLLFLHPCRNHRTDP